MNIKVAEHFYSIQGEGSTAGTPAVFLRLSGCVLNCKWCDTVEVWKNGKDITLDELNTTFVNAGYWSHLQSGAHLILTGGDPLMQQAMLSSFLETYGTPRWFVECETEGIIAPIERLASWINQFNVSPKLANSGEPESRRKRWSTLEFHASRDEDIFKFPVQYEGDLAEVEEYVERLNLDAERVFLMPVCSTAAEHQEKAIQVAEWCKERHWQFSPRLQLVIWDRTVGV